MAAKKLNSAQVAQLGGQTVADRYGPEYMRMLGARGGNATLAKHGKAHMLRMNHKRHGYLQDEAQS